MFVVDGITKIQEEWGEEPDDFRIFAHCEISEYGQEGGEAVSLTVVSPKWLARTISETGVPELGIGIVVAVDYNEREICRVVSSLLKNASTWSEVEKRVSGFLTWV